MARKRNKKKSILFWLGTLVILIVTANIGKNFFVKSAIEKSATAALQVPVTIQDLNLSLLNGEISIHGLTIANPKGFESPELFRIAELESRINLSSLTQPTILIDYIRINGTTVYYEINKNGNNIGSLYKNLNTSTKPESAPENTTKKSAKSQRQLIIRDLSITNAAVEPSITLGGQTLGKRVPLADMHLRDIGREGKTVSVAEAAEIVVATIGKNAGQRLPGNIFEQGLGNITKGLKDIGQGILGNLGN